MCGRFALSAEYDDIKRLIGAKNNIVYRPHYNIAPGNTILTINENLEFELKPWGLMPSWKKAGNPFINVRLENILEKRSFRKIYKENRCIVLADGYYEWQKLGRDKVPCFIQRSTCALFGMAAVYDASGVAILTQPARQDLSIIHDRMPVVLDTHEFHMWFARSGKKYKDEFSFASVEKSFMHRRVSKKVNNVLNDDLSCTKS